MPERVMHPAEQIVRRFLALVSAFDLDGGRTLIAPGARMVFPGGASSTDFADMLARLKSRYRRCDKTFERFDVIEQATGDTIVYCYGTLEGEWADGTPYSGIRYIDRFVIRDGRITDQKVWNDTAFVRPPPAPQ